MLKSFQEVGARIENALRCVTETKAVEIGKNNLDRAASLFRRCFPDKNAILIADANTFEAAGRAVQASFDSDPDVALLSSFLFEGEPFSADRRRVDRIREVLSNGDAVPVAVGSGTINDMVKLAAFEADRPYMIVATAASMDGYTAYGASIEIDSFKQTKFCPAPLAVLVDMEVIVRAPVEMNASGYADLIAKVPAGADWILADLIGTEPIDSIAWDMVQSKLRSWLRNPNGIRERNPESLLNLIEGLLVSGLAMQKAKSSRTASGAEHLFSHLWDNEHHTYRGVAPSHGFKVGVGTLVSTALYEKMLSLDRPHFREAHERTAKEAVEWNTVEAEIRDSFENPDQVEQVLRESRAKFVEKEEIQRRFELYLEEWELLQDRLSKQLLPFDVIRGMLRDCGAPSHPGQTGIDAPRLARSCRRAGMIRSRYNILDFAKEQGFWKEWIPDAVSRVIQ